MSQMVRIAGGDFLMGSVDFYADEGPIHQRAVADFELDTHPVTNAEFAEFVTATGYVTVAERPLPAADFPEMSADEREPGALLFVPTPGPVSLDDWQQWWRWVPGAHWRSPAGPGSHVRDRPDHPVIDIAYEDANAYAAWVGKRLPTETEWEYAARGGLESATYAWGDELHPEGALMANNWQGSFPYHNTGALGWAGTSPVGLFPPNGFGLFDIIGNVWEWTSDLYRPRHTVPDVGPLSAPSNVVNLLSPQTSTQTSTQTSSQRSPEPAAEAGSSCGSGCQCGPGALRAALSEDPGGGSAVDTRRVLKGGSHLCAPEYCLRYRPAARSPQAEDTATSHIGFRCARTVV